MPQSRKDPIPTEPPEPDPTPSVGEPHEPEWARQLQRTLAELPGKLRASLTDDDRSSIAEKVHELFERSGAFTRDEPENDPDDDVSAHEPKREPEPAPKQDDEPPAKQCLARRLGFPQY